jgi:hypothetical protein
MNFLNYRIVLRKTTNTNLFLKFLKIFHWFSQIRQVVMWHIFRFGRSRPEQLNDGDAFERFREHLCSIIVVFFLNIYSLGKTVLNNNKNPRKQSSVL